MQTVPSTTAGNWDLSNARANAQWLTAEGIFSDKSIYSSGFKSSPLDSDSRDCQWIMFV
jgi:flagellar motor protein MotB